jgi:hypothetical protein
MGNENNEKLKCHHGAKNNLVENIDQLKVISK